MYNINYLYKDTHALKINWLRTQLSKLPRGTIVAHGNIEHVIVYPKRELNIKNRFQRSLATDEGKQLAAQVIRYSEYAREFKELETLWKQTYRIPVPTINVCNEMLYQRKENDMVTPRLVLDERAYECMVPKKNNHPKDRWIEFNGVLYRSIQERIIAEVITAFGWDFKYEVSYKYDNNIMSCDFTIYIRELGRVVLLEFLGMMDSERYLLKVKKKMGEYASMGLVEDKDVIYIFADEKDSINTRLVAHKLNMIIMNYI